MNWRTVYLIFSELLHSLRGSTLVYMKTCLSNTLVTVLTCLANYWESWIRYSKRWIKSLVLLWSNVSRILKILLLSSKLAALSTMAINLTKKIPTHRENPKNPWTTLPLSWLGTPLSQSPTILSWVKSTTAVLTTLCVRASPIVIWRSCLTTT